MVNGILMTRRQGTGWFAAALSLVALAAARTDAQSGGDSAHDGIELATVIEKVVEAKQSDGATKVELLPVAVAAPGDEVVYTVTFTNVSKQAADNVRITNPIPSELRYLPNSAFGPGSEVLYSVDGGLTYGAPKELTVTADDASRRPADASDYTHIRWVLKAPLDAGAKGFARFRAVVR
jgi:uncharacterized repeat protein (TIGR01451 family)